MFQNLMSKIKGLFTGSFSWLALSSQAYAVYRLAQNYPGVANEANLREWLQSACDTSGELAKLSETEIDDKIVATAAAVIADDDGWDFIYSLFCRVGSLTDLPEKWDEPESAATIIAAIGLLVQLVAKIREKRGTQEVWACAYAASAKAEKIKKE